MEEDGSGDLWWGARGGDVYIKMNFVHNPQQHHRHTPQQPHPPVDQPLPHQPFPPDPADQPWSRMGGSRRARKCCCTSLETLCLLLLILFICSCVLLPSAAYFIPRELLVNISSQHAVTNARPPNANFGTMGPSLDIRDLTQNCSQGFLYTTHPIGNSCVPSCEGFRLDGSVNGISVYRLVLMVAGAFSCISGLGFVLLAMTAMRKTIFSFPRIYTLYMCITSVVIAVVILVGAVRGDLYCGSEDMITDSFTNGTVFCTVSGVLFCYTSLQLMLWTAFMAATLMWAVTCPHSYARSKEAGHLRLLHSLSVVVALVIPIVASLIQLEVGFRRVGVPPIVCLGRNESYLYYALSLSLSVVGVVPSAGLVVIGWMLIKNCRTAQHSAVMTCLVKFKTFLLLLSTLIAGWSVTCSLLYYLIYNDIMSQELTNRFTCESGGPEDCPASLTWHLGVFQKFLTTSVGLLMLQPLVILTLNTELGCMNCCCCRRKSRKQEDSENSSTS